MAEKINKTEYEKANVNPFSAPTPGGSLTGSPDMPQAWERPPQLTEQDEAMETIYLELTSDEALMPLIDMINEGVPLDQIAQVILYRGYTQGKFNPDLMLMLAEPTIYLLIAIADYANIKDYVLYEGEEDDPDGAIYGDDVEPVSMDDDDDDKEKATQPKDESEITEYEEPSSDSLSSSLLSKVKKELPSKIKNLQENK
jgi:hypothetical protein|tara:strand:- start:661 stop:1257 length:597 start_codon:yes stop_codon:yes gene_type:complete